jgi:predicted nuclease of predicted toxin-antitoxin system
MTIWVDAQLSPAIAARIGAQFGVTAVALRDLGLRDSTDRQIFAAAGAAGAVVMTKDGDFACLVSEFGPPPQVLWPTCGNTSNVRLKQILVVTLHRAMMLLDAGEPLVEINAT